MPRRSTRQIPARVKSKPAAIQGNSRSRRYWWLAGLSGLIGILSLVLIAGWMDRSPGRMRRLAEAATRSGQWHTAREHWHAINNTEAASAFTHLEEARACLALGQAFEAEAALRRSISADPANLEPWRLLLEILRVEDRTLEVLQAGWKAYKNVPVEGRRALLREITLGVLADLPDDLVRTTLRRWIDADEDDLNARIALLHRITIQPREADPDRLTLLSELESIVARFPDQTSAREVLVTALADSGEPERGRVLLKDWPIDTRDARYWRLRGRWDLEYDHRAGDAVIAFRKALSELPQDWRSWYRLARASMFLVARMKALRLLRLSAAFARCSIRWCWAHGLTRLLITLTSRRHSVICTSSVPRWDLINLDKRGEPRHRRQFELPERVLCEQNDYCRRAVCVKQLYC